MRKIVFVLLMLAFTSFPCFADCVVVDNSFTDWGKGRDPDLWGVSYSVAGKVGRQNIQPTVRGNQVCFNNPTFDINSVITNSQLQAEYNALVLNQTNAQTSRINEREGLKTKLRGLGLTDREIKILSSIK